MNSPKLILIPTPLYEELALPLDTLNTLKDAAARLLAGEKIAIVGEDPKPTRARWVKWGLQRELLPHLLYLNENDSGELQITLQKLLKSGGEVYLFSDGGMPAFCDPGIKLIQFCHDQNIKVSATTCDNSVILALSMSGAGDRFSFCGFPPKIDHDRKLFLKNCLSNPQTVVLIDTPYRLNRLLQEIVELGQNKNRDIFLAMDLNNPNEELINTSIWDLKSRKSIDFGKREFVLILKALPQ